MIKKMVVVCLAISVVLFGSIAKAGEVEKLLGSLTYRPLVWNTQNTLDRKYLRLHGGEYASDGSAYAETLHMTEYATGDLNGDGITDAVVILVHSLGGSGCVLQMAAVLGKGLVHVASVNLGSKYRVIYVTIGSHGRVEMKLTTNDNVISCRTYHFRGNRFIKG